MSDNHIPLPDEAIEDFLPEPDQWDHWNQWVAERLPLLGHRNWIVVADSAYPAQARSGIETIALRCSQQAAIERVLAALRASHHVRPIVHLDEELAYVDPRDAPGVDTYRSWLGKALSGFAPRASPHEEIIARLDRVAQTFGVTIFKTTMTLPYTSVFFELDCAYWSAEAEHRLRAAIRDDDAGR